jgi:hypothetical protein
MRGETRSKQNRRLAKALHKTARSKPRPRPVIAAALDHIPAAPRESSGVSNYLLVRDSGNETVAVYPGQTIPVFALREPIRVPEHVHSSQQASIVGREWGGNRRSSGQGWLYYIKFVEGGQWWEASEAEMVRWQGNGKAVQA